MVVSADNVDTSDGNTNLVTSVDDDKLNQWVKLREFTNAQGNAGAGATVAIFYCIADQQVDSLGFININFGSNITAKAASCWEFTLAADMALKIDSSSDKADDGVDPTSIAISGLSSASRLYIRCIAGETSNTSNLTVTTNFTAITNNQTSGAAAASNMAVRAEFRINTSTGETSDPTWTSADHASTMLALSEVARFTNQILIDQGDCDQA